MFIVAIGMFISGYRHGARLAFRLESRCAWQQGGYSRNEYQIKEENQTGFQVGPMLQYQTGFYGLALDFSLLYVQRGVKLTNTANGASTDVKTQSIDIPIELKWEMGISDNFDLFLGVGPSFSFLVDEDNWGRKLAI